MSNAINFKINSYKDLKHTKALLRSEIEDQEMSFKNNPIFKISSSFFKGGSFKSIFQSSFDSVSFDELRKMGQNLLSTVLMANKKTRKFFIAFIIAKEMVPFTLQKINDLLKKQELN